MGSFVDDCLDGSASPEHIDAYIEEWRHGAGAEPLHRFLGITEAQLVRWHANPATLPWILASYEPKPFAVVGPQCHTGWAALYEPIIALCKNRQVEIVQIKEKFGALRINTEPARPPREIERAIRDASSLSLKICEICGESGLLRDPGVERRLKTLCDEHMQQYSLGEEFDLPGPA